MGSFLSIPVTQKPEIYELPSQVQRDDDEIFQEFNENICKTMRRQNLRSRQELNLLNAYRRNWSSVVEKLMKKYPKWSSEDILNLRYRYEIVAKRYGYLLHFCNFNELLDSISDESSPEQRREMFSSVDTHHFYALNFKEYLQIMDKIGIETPVPRPPGVDEDRDEIMVLIDDLLQCHMSTQMVYKVF
ncbi:uncharacterized protein LOC557261 [Danio rerio]|uniref:Si:ch211-122l24.6 n=2 Tax=Danio rerio TaxID=7955 RepID=B0S7S9_DANRE|nr:uncharacterized protein LOC557261 [Danio rerio]|eukprot:NP_001119861.1 uncharacterized protein LOC557261 [Danio rerio]